MNGKIDNSIPRRQDVSEHVERTWEVLHETSCKCSLKDSSLLPTIFIFIFEGWWCVTYIRCMEFLNVFPVTVEIEG